MSNDGSGQTHIFTSFPESHDEMHSEINLENEQKTSLLEDNFTSEKTYSVWQIEYYQKYFNLSTSDFISRLIGSVIPSFGENSLLNKIRPSPDLYGPFWITTTLICTIAIGGNLVSFIQNFGKSYTWQTDFHKVTSSAFTIVLYSLVLPAILYVILRSRQARAELEFIEILCIYGYSLAIYVPVSLLWLINVPFLQWTFVLIAIILSSSVLFVTFWPIFGQDQNRNVGLGIMLVIVLLNALLGIGFMLYFFHNPSPGPNVTTTILNQSTTKRKKLDDVSDILKRIASIELTRDPHVDDVILIELSNPYKLNNDFRRKLLDKRLSRRRNDFLQSLDGLEWRLSTS
ncbi:unnamed protein product [Brachionus calyciflorus]|uniref:Protein YIPF n=1 Tax=Brachionus calyciflorus TaxID=104777 RepID=A0A813Z1R3_9BILA|nr:unnamed protein product [Brachionus calyciflorus]